MTLHHYLIDPGHGVDTPGKRSPEWGDLPQLFEYEFNRDIASRLLALCQSNEVDASILVPEEHDVPLHERVRRANEHYEKHGNSIVISIHANAAGVGASHFPASGFEVFTSDGQTTSDLLATNIFNQVQRLVPDWKFRADYGDGDPDKEAQFYILRNTRCPAVLTENGFMTHRLDCERLLSDDFRKTIARYHLFGILTFEEMIMQG